VLVWQVDELRAWKPTAYPPMIANSTPIAATSEEDDYFEDAQEELIEAFGQKVDVSDQNDSEEVDYRVQVAD
jgi:hypothetical protein